MMFKFRIVIFFNEIQIQIHNSQFNITEAIRKI